MDTISVKWTHTALEAIRHIGSAGVGVDRNRIGPPMVARSLALLHTAIYDFYEGNVAGLTLGRKVGAHAFERAHAYWSGRP